VPERIDELTQLGKVRLLYRDRDATVGFMLLPVPHRPDGQRALDLANWFTGGTFAPFRGDIGAPAVVRLGFRVGE
jgi:hypothetical protein